MISHALQGNLEMAHWPDLKVSQILTGQVKIELVGAELLPPLISVQSSNWIEMGFSSQVMLLGEIIDSFSDLFYYRMIFVPNTFIYTLL